MKTYHNRFCSCGRQYAPGDQAVMCEGCGKDNPLPPERQNDRAEALELVLLYSKDILTFWPQFSFKTVPIMMKKMDALKQAVQAVK